MTVTLPYLNEPVLSIELSADTVILNTNIGLGVSTYHLCNIIVCLIVNTVALRARALESCHHL